MGERQGQSDETGTPRLREMTVGELIERLQELPAHRFVSPMIDGVLGAGIAVWQMHDPQTNDVVVVFGESKQPVAPIVPPAWSRPTRPESEADRG